MPTSTTRKTIRQNIIKRLYRRKYPVTGTFSGNASAASAVKDTALSPAALDRDYLNAWINIVSTDASGPAWGEWARVTDADFDNDELNIAPSFTATPQSGQEYEVHYDMHPDSINDLIDEIMENLEYQILVPITLITDGAMELSGTANWGSGVNSSYAKDTTTVRHGKQSLKVTANAAAGYRESVTVNVTPSTTAIVSSDLYISNNDEGAKVYLWDKTNDAEIESGTANVVGWSNITFTAAIPATCEEVAIRLEATNLGDIIYFDNAILQIQGQEEYDFPSQAEWSFDLKELFYFPLGKGINTTSAEFNYKLGDKGKTFWSHYDIEEDETAVVPYRLIMHKAPESLPVWAAVEIDYPLFSGATYAAKDADTTAVHPTVIRNLVIAEIWEAEADEAHREESTEYALSLKARAREMREEALALRELEPPESLVTGALVKRG